MLGRYPRSSQVDRAKTSSKPIRRNHRGASSAASSQIFTISHNLCRMLLRLDLGLSACAVPDLLKLRGLAVRIFASTVLEYIPLPSLSGTAVQHEGALQLETRWVGKVLGRRFGERGREGRARNLPLTWASGFRHSESPRGTQPTPQHLGCMPALVADPSTGYTFATKPAQARKCKHLQYITYLHYSTVQCSFWRTIQSCMPGCISHRFAIQSFHGCPWITANVTSSL